MPSLSNKKKSANLLRLLSISLLASLLASCSEEADIRLSTEGFLAPEPRFETPYIDIDEWRETPVKHRYIHGGFKDTNTRFSFYFPHKNQYEGRFFQYITPVPDSENLSQGQSGESDKIGFSVASGAYFVETNGGGPVDPRDPNNDATVGAYRANAAAAQFSRHLAEQLYGKGRAYGYAFGGSGGAFRTIAGAENTEGVWDGVVPFVLGSPMALPNMFTIRTYAMRVLEHKLPQIADRLDVGSAINPYHGLTNEEAAALREATQMGFPPEGWQLHETLGLHAYAVIYPILRMIDPTYFDDFWTKLGYEGYEGSPSLQASLVESETAVAETLTLDQALQAGLRISNTAGTPKGRADDAWQTAGNTQVDQTPVAIRLETTFPNSIIGADMSVLTGANVGTSVLVTQTQGPYVVFDGQTSQSLAMLSVGDRVNINNRDFLASQTYHRHQVPSPDFPVWDQYRDENGNPMYPQRRLVGPMLAKGATGKEQTGAFNGKMILVENLHDTEAFPWQGDWYRRQVQKHFADQTDRQFRLWMTDHANHGDSSHQTDHTHTVSYLGVLHQALWELSQWVEKGQLPADNTVYQLEQGQIEVPIAANKRKGIQPTVQLRANGASRAEAAVKDKVVLEARVEIPPQGNPIVEAAWDLDGSGAFKVKATPRHPNTSGNTLTYITEVSFDKAGTYFPVLRVASQDERYANTPYAMVQNLGRVRVVVSE